MTTCFQDSVAQRNERFNVFSSEIVMSRVLIFVYSTYAKRRVSKHEMKGANKRLALIDLTLLNHVRQIHVVQ